MPLSSSMPIFTYQWRGTGASDSTLLTGIATSPSKVPGLRKCQHCSQQTYACEQLSRDVSTQTLHPNTTGQQVMPREVLVACLTVAPIVTTCRRALFFDVLRGASETTKRTLKLYQPFTEITWTVRFRLRPKMSVAPEGGTRKKVRQGKRKT